MKIRSGFVSNSSSSSFIVISDKGILEKPEFQETLIVDRKLGETEFGWGPETIYGFGSRLIFAYLQALDLKNLNSSFWVEYVKREAPYIDFSVDYVKKIEDILIENNVCKYVDWKVSMSYDIDFEYTWGYIDHQSAACEGKNLEMFENDESLYNFLFNSYSSIRLDNDNY